MKKEKKSRVSWPSDSMLCQVKLFLSEDYPAKVASQSSISSNMNILPPGFEATEYATKRPNIPRIKWKRPPKYMVSDALLVGSGGESTETRTENLRISKVFEAFYPHRSVIPTSPSSVSLAVENESYDDKKTPNIRLTPVEDEHPSKQGSLVDADLLVKLLSDPNIVKNLMNEMAGKTNHTLNTNITKPTRMTQPANVVPHTTVRVSVATVEPLSKPNATAMSINIQKPPPVVHTYPLSSGPNPLPTRLQASYTTAHVKPITVDSLVVSQPKPQLQSLNISTSSTWKVSEAGQTGISPQLGNGAYPMNINRDDQVSAKPPVKNLEYFKNLIREHGGGTPTPATNESNNNKGRVDNNNNNKTEVVKAKFQKPCMYFGRARGCKLGESCLYLHDRSKRLWTADVAAEFPRAKRLKFGT